VISAFPTALLADWRRLSQGKSLDVGSLRAAIEQADDDIASLIDLSVSDASKPYGRRVLLESGSLEVMVARWTRGRTCSPHNHGGSVGAVRVLQGRSRHVIWQPTREGLKCIDESVAGVGDVLVCGPDMVHSMGDAGAELPLVTLHMYTHAIDHMVVYDTTEGDTLIVEGSSGAWVPEPTSGHLRRRVLGYHQAHELA